MSLKGQLLRGEKWYLMNRETDGTLKKVIKEDANKMKEVNLYLKTRDPVKEEPKEEIKDTKDTNSKSKGKK